MVRPYLVIVLAPDLDLAPCVSKMSKPMSAQALVAKLPIEALDEAVFDRLARADEVELDTTLIGPGI